MQNRDSFVQSLMELMEIAHTNGNELNMDEIQAYFSDIELDQEKLELIYHYFESNHIQVEGHIKNQEITDIDEGESDETLKTALPDEEQVIRMYLEELNGLVTLDKEEKDKQISLVKKGDDAAKSRVTQHYLQKVVDYANQYKNQGVTTGDLIQEGNMGLIQGVDEFTGESNQDFDAYIEKCIIKCMTDAIREQAMTTKTAADMAKKANRLSDISKQLNDDLGREATIEELAKEMQLTGEEIHDIMKISLDAVNHKNAE